MCVFHIFQVVVHVVFYQLVFLKALKSVKLTAVIVQLRIVTSEGLVTAYIDH